MKRNAIICDIDGTVANGKHRQHWVAHKPKNWNAYNAAMHNDSPIEAVIMIISVLSLAFDIIVCSGRQDKDRKVTEEWFEKHGIPYSEMHMRPTGDYRDDTVIKEEMLAKIRQTHEVVAAFDDRHKVVNKWRDLGIYVFDCNQSREIF